eukprot:XP_022275935.1 testisin-like isoform X1 [Canis lupus familiaris]
MWDELPAGPDPPPPTTERGGASPSPLPPTRFRELVVAHVALRLPQNPAAHVVGGKDLEPGQWPWQGSQLRGRHQHCGASLLSCRVLKAMHCFLKHSDPLKWTAHIGELSSRPHYWKLWTFYHRYRVKDIIIYPQFEGTSLNDIALLKLSSSVTYNKYIQPICVMISSSKFQNQTNCWVTGWGDIQENQGVQLLNHVVIPYLTF